MLVVVGPGGNIVVVGRSVDKAAPLTAIVDAVPAVIAAIVVLTAPTGAIVEPLPVVLLDTVTAIVPETGAIVVPVEHGPELTFEISGIPTR